MSSGILDAVIAQVVQPYFYYSFLLLTLSLLCVHLLLRCDLPLTSALRSKLYIFPLIVPLAVMTIFTPSVYISVVQMWSPGFGGSAGAGPSSWGPAAQGAASQYPLYGHVFNDMHVSQTLSLTGILCISGILLSLVFYALMRKYGDRVAIKALKIIMLTEEDFPELQASIHRMSEELNIKPPRVGLIEDLVPNAFTTGSGNKSMVVFSIGMLELLDNDELEAVAAHELSHIKNDDFVFKTMTTALLIASFYNPFAYLAARASQRRREELADETAASYLRSPSALSSALEKLDRIAVGLPRPGLSTRINVRLFAVSPVRSRNSILSDHPSVDLRISRLQNMPEKKKGRGPAFLAVGLAIVIILAGIALSFSMIEARSAIIESAQLGVEHSPPPDLNRTVAFSEIRSVETPLEPRSSMPSIGQDLPALREILSSGSTQQ